MKTSLVMAASMVAVLLATATAANAQVDGSPQSELDAAMKLTPGGVQVSDNAVVWGDGDVVLVVPDAGSSVAPSGLGSNIRADRVRTPALQALVEQGENSNKSVVAQGSSSTCPHGVTVSDYYCFYQYSNFNGRRVQFTGATQAAYAANYGFDNGTSSWVSWDVDCRVRSYDNAGSTLLWTQNENSQSSYVGSTNDNRMSFWTCT